MIARKPLDLLTNSAALQEALELCRALSRFEVVASIDGKLVRCPLRISGDNAVISVDITETPLLSVRSRGGNFRLIGWHEFTDVSTPPRAYLAKTLSGGYVFTHHTGAPGATTMALAGSCVYDPITGALTSGGSLTQGGITTPNCGSVFLSEDGGRKTVTTRITQGWGHVHDPAQVFDALNGTTGVYTTLNGIATLEQEDTEQAAIARLLNGAAWSPWQSAGVSVLARHENRTSFIGMYQEIQYRVRREFLAPGTLVGATVDVYRSPYGLSAFSLHRTISASGTVDDRGVLEITGNVPNDPGFESYVANAAIRS